MPDLAAAGPSSVALAAIATLIANVAYFQTWTGTANATDAGKSVYLGEAGYAIRAISAAAGVLTVTLVDPAPRINVGDMVTLSGASVGSQSNEIDLDTTWTVIGVDGPNVTLPTGSPDFAALSLTDAFLFPGARPFAVVMESEQRGADAQIIGIGGVAIYAGMADILLEADVSDEYASDPVNALMEARNAFGQFVQGLAEASGTEDLAVLNRIETAAAPMFIEHEEQDDSTVRFERWRAMVRVHWGLES